LYRVKIKYNTKDGTEKIVHNIIDSSGNVKATIGTTGLPKVVDSLNLILVNLRSDRARGQYAVQSLVQAATMAQEGLIQPGSIVDVIENMSGANAATGLMKRSTLIYLDPSDLTFKRLREVYTGEDTIVANTFNIDATKAFLVYNESLNPEVSLAATGMSAVPLAKGTGVGNIDLRDRYVHYSDYQNKAGVTTRKKYRGGKEQEFFTDDVNPETGMPVPNADAVKAIEENIQIIKQMRDVKGLSPVFNKSGYGQYMIGADETTGKMFVDKSGNKIGEPVAPETFKYLSRRLLEEFGYINPNFVKEAEGIKEVVRVAKQPITDEEYFDLMNKCFM
jgi:hypothetical protein